MDAEAGKVTFFAVDQEVTMVAIPFMASIHNLATTLSFLRLKLVI